VSLDEAEHSEATAYRSFNDFFTRALAPGLRPLPEDPRAIVCPADGTISQAGELQGGTLLQAKGHRYTLDSLVTDPRIAERFNGGSFATIYLAPNDYHRVHSPADATVTDTIAVPGALFSVNSRTEAGIEGLFCRNERLVCVLQGEIAPLLVVLVGALIVASIETSWRGPASPYLRRTQHTPAHRLDRGVELGRFLLGSTVIVCLPADRATLTRDLEPGQTVRMGETIAHWVG
jgi:phosphatidylserine decarboxylase